MAVTPFDLADPVRHIERALDEALTIGNCTRVPESGGYLVQAASLLLPRPLTRPMVDLLQARYTKWRLVAEGETNITSVLFVPNIQGPGGDG